MTQPKQPKRPTRGQQHILQLLCRVNYVLLGESVPFSTAPSRVSYRIVERETGRDVQTLAIPMVASLTEAKWIASEHATRDPATGMLLSWSYRVTQAGIAAAN